MEGFAVSRRQRRLGSLATAYAPADKARDGMAWLCDGM
jgi:hypothetical protein